MSRKSRERWEKWHAEQPPVQKTVQPVHMPLWSRKKTEEAFPLFREQPFQKKGSSGHLRWGVTAKNEICITDYVKNLCPEYSPAVIHVPAELDGCPVTELDGFFVKYAHYPDAGGISRVELHLPPTIKRVHPKFREVQEESYGYTEDWGWECWSVHRHEAPFVIYGEPGSYAEKLAREHGLKFRREK